MSFYYFLFVSANRDYIIIFVILDLSKEKFNIISGQKL